MFEILNGLELLQKIKLNPETRSVKVVAVTGHSDSDSREKFLKAGCHAVVAKPINFGNFGSQIEKFLASSES